MQNISYKVFCFIFFGTIFNFSVISQELYDDPYQWKIPGGKYVDPVSFFSLHGYVNALYAGPSEQWMEGYFNGIGVPGQMNIPITNVSSFTQDAALWIGSELTDDISVVIELHFLFSCTGDHREFEGTSDPVNVRADVGLVVTEANLRLKLIENYLAVSAGTFWSVFGIQNKDWLSAQNLFSMMPLASGAYLTHYNERGLRLDGYVNKGDWGLNYVFSVGNGNKLWDFEGYSHLDLNENKAINSRVSVFPGFGEQLNFGVSYGKGLIFEQSLVAYPAVGLYDSEFEAWGIDVTGNYKGFALRSYLISSTETYTSDQDKTELDHTGFMAELSYDIDTKGKFGVQTIRPKFRFDTLDKSEFVTPESDVYRTLSAGVNIEIKQNVVLSVDYNWLEEKYNVLDNNRMVARISANF